MRPYDCLNYTGDEMTGHGFQSMTSNLLNESGNGILMWSRGLWPTRIGMSSAQRMHAGPSGAIILMSSRQKERS